MMTEPTVAKSNLDGWLVIDKPAGPSSAKGVRSIKRLACGRKVGHGGTLDPLATGVLPIAIGEATKTVAYAMEGRKSYRFTTTWGEARETDDCEGEISETSPVRPSKSAIQAALPEFTGEINQVPPAYSAIKVAGKRAYALARRGKEVTLVPRKIWIEKLELVEFQPGSAIFEVTCGKGTYIRALARDLAKRLGTVGHVSQLRRTAVGPFNEKVAISLDIMETLVHSARLAEQVLPVDTALADIPALELTEYDALRLRSGQTIAVNGTDCETIRVTTGKRLVALAKIRTGHLRSLRVFNL